MTYIARRNRARSPTHPGALLREEVIPATGRTKSEIARLLGISRQHLYDILGEGKPVSASCRGSPRQAVRRWCRSMDAHAGGVRYLACRAGRGCKRHPDDPGESGLGRQSEGSFA